MGKCRRNGSYDTRDVILEDTNVQYFGMQILLYCWLKTQITCSKMFQRLYDGVGCMGLEINILKSKIIVFEKEM